MCVHVGISLVSRMTSYYAQNSLCTLLIFFLNSHTEPLQSKFPSQSCNQEQISCVHTAKDSLYHKGSSV